jgi:hypothetical protein
LPVLYCLHSSIAPPAHIPCQPLTLFNRNLFSPHLAGSLAFGLRASWSAQTGTPVSAKFIWLLPFVVPAFYGPTFGPQNGFVNRHVPDFYFNFKTS